MDALDRIASELSTIGAVSAVGPEGVIRMDSDGSEFEMDIAIAEDNAHALLAAVQHLRNNSNATK